MFDPFKQARDAEKQAAVEAVEAACADGQITRADADLRLERLQRVRTLGEIHAITRDLRGAEVEQPRQRSGDLVSEATSVTPAAHEVDRPTESRSGIGVVAAVLLFLVLLGVGLAGVLFAR